MSIKSMGDIIIHEMGMACRDLNDDGPSRIHIPRNERIEASIEPVIAYVRAKTENGEFHYLVSRHAAFATLEHGNVRFVSYRSPVGRIAAHMPGDALKIRLPGNESFDLQILETDRFLPSYKDKVWDATNNQIILADGRYSILSFSEYLSNAEIHELEKGLAKPDLVKVSLRDQFILDQVQDEVFRLPIGSSIILTGTAGTGKTTVLVKRIGLKRSLVFKNEGEERLAPNVIDTIYALPESRRWILFTPTTDLMVYLKEALSKEQIPAPESMIKTWVNFSLALARDLGILNQNRLKLLKNTGVLRDRTSPALSRFTDELRSGFRDKIQSLPAQLGDWIIKVKVSDRLSAENVSRFVDQMRNYAFGRIRVNDTSLYPLIRGLLNFYQNILQSTAGEGFKDNELRQLVPLAKEFWQTKGLGTLDGFKVFLIESYAVVRRSIYRSGVIELNLPDESNVISPLELDSLLCLLLEIGSSHLADNAPFARSSDSFVSVYQETIRTAVYVDEAPDFSATQLRCMSLVSHPLLPNIVVSGDMMQKLSAHGLQKWEECDWAFDCDKIHNLHTVYRHSSTLFELAQALYGHAENISNGYDRSTADIRPVAKAYTDDTDLCQWLVSSIREASRRFSRMPSMAIFVDTEADIVRILNLIENELYGDGIKVEACPEGKIASADNVKIMTIDYIKGLEFECVFIVDIDLISTRFQGFETKVLYLGATRAASVLGMAYSIEYPQALEPVKGFFDLK